MYYKLSIFYHFSNNISLTFEQKYFKVENIIEKNLIFFEGDYVK